MKSQVWTTWLMVMLILSVPAAGGVLDFSNYHSPTQVNQALSTLTTTYPGLTQLSTIAISIEGRPVKVLKISDNPTVSETNEGDIVFVAAHHAREWISVEMALYLADELLARYSTDPVLQADLNNLQVWIVPVVNPDGVQFTWIDPADNYYRMWRKNRRNNGDGTHGVDLNRNWGYQWGGVGSSGLTSSDIYRGTGPFSEPEIAQLRSFLQGLNDLKALVTYHSFGEYFLRPWSYTNNDPPGEPTLKSMSDRSIALIAAVHGHVYATSLYNCSGTTIDYIWHEFRSAAFTPELRPGPTGSGGFAPPASEILPSSQENLPVALALIHDAARTGLFIQDYAGDTGDEPSAVWTGAGWTHAFWVSPDIWTVPEILNQGATVDLNVRVNNNTGSMQQNATVEVYYTDPRISLEFPNPDAHLIGTKTVNIPSGGKTVTFSWTVPVGTNIWGERHWCVGALVKHENDMPLTTQVQRSSNIGCRNFNTTEIVESGTLMLAVTNYLHTPAELVIEIDPDSSVDEWAFTLPILQEVSRTLCRCCCSARKARLLDAKGMILEPGETRLLPLHVQIPQGVPAGTAGEVRVHGGLLPLVAGVREAAGNGYTYRLVAGEQ